MVTLLSGHGFLARYGGEEFAVSLPDTDPVAAAALVESLLRTVAGGQTCSIGIAARQPDEAAAQITARADQALYEAKGTGRNRTVWHDSDGPPCVSIGPHASKGQAPSAALSHSRLP